LNLALSPDGSKAYVANSTSSFVVVLDTQTRTVINSFLMPQAPYDVVFANQNRLFVLAGNTIYQIDATTGASTGPSITSVVYSGALEISPDRNTLYYGQYGLSPTSMYKFDVSGTTQTLVKQTDTGSNGQDLTLSHDGTFICHPNGAPYLIPKYRTSDFANLGSYNTGAYPREAAFSPDDAVVYAVHTSGQIDVFDANTFLSTGNITAAGEATELSVDSSGRYLFAGYTDSFGGATSTRVYDTNRVVAIGAVSRKAHGSAGAFDVPLPLTGAAGIECRSGGASNDYTIVVTFAVPVTFTSASVTTGTGSVMSSSGSGTNTLTFNLTGVTDVQCLKLTLVCVDNAMGSSGDVSIAMRVLVGDTTNSGTVNASDIGDVKSNSGQTANATNFRSDVVVSGIIGASDIGLVKSKAGNTVPACP
jgi:YVTN family beta-propeller protein